MAEQIGLKQAPVCLEHSSCESTGGRDDTETSLPQAKKIRVYPRSGAQPRGDPLCSMASSSLRRSFMPSMRASDVHACIMQAGRQAFSSTVSSLVMNISSMHHAGAGSGETSIVDHAVAHIAGCTSLLECLMNQPCTFVIRRKTIGSGAAWRGSKARRGGKRERVQVLLVARRRTALNDYHGARGQGGRRVRHKTE